MRPSPKARSRPGWLPPWIRSKDLITFSSKYANVSPLPVGAYDGNVASLTAKLLKRYHYDRRGLDSALSERFLDRYFNLLDPMRIHFLKPDIAEFGRLRDRLPELTLERGDSSKANEIFARFLQRVDQRVEYVAGLLVENQFDFTGSDRHTPNRKDADWPDTLDSARELLAPARALRIFAGEAQQAEAGGNPQDPLGPLQAPSAQLGELDNEEVLQVYLTALSQAYDPHSDYMGKAQLENFAISMKLSLFGIGALLRSEDGYCKIESLVPGGPAARSKKIKPNDRIVAVAQKDQESVDVIDMKLTKVVEMIEGPRGPRSR